MIAYDELVSALALWRESNGLSAVAADYLGAPPPPGPVSFAAYDNQPAQSESVEEIPIESSQIQDEINVIHDDYPHASHSSVLEDVADPLAEFSDEPTEFGVAPMTVAQNAPPMLSGDTNSGADAILDDALFDIPLDVDESAILEQQDINSTFNNDDDVAVIASAMPGDPIDGAADWTLDQEASAEVSAAQTELASGSIENLPSSLPDSADDGSDTPGN